MVVSIGELLLTFPYGLALSATAFIGNVMGAKRPELGKSNARLFMIFSMCFAFLVCGSLSYFRHQVISLYGATPLVRELADPTILAFSIAFLFDWT